MKITKDFIPAGRKNRPGKANPMRYITVHNTGNVTPGAGARSHAGYIKTDDCANRPASWHYTVDDVSIYQHLPDNETAYHAGDKDGPGNTQSIGIEICQNADGDLLTATDNAAWLVSELMLRYDVPIENVKQHYDWSKKDCPQMIRAGKPYNWVAFLAKVIHFYLKDEKNLLERQFDELMEKWLARQNAITENQYQDEKSLAEWNAAVARGIVTGGMPRGLVTREQAAIMVQRAVTLL
jgi:N-acetylmuramoyl-L-alanine amidase